jgi:hypothetical protein
MKIDKKIWEPFSGVLTKNSVNLRIFVANSDLRNTLLGKTENDLEIDIRPEIHLDQQILTLNDGASGC